MGSLRAVTFARAALATAAATFVIVAAGCSVLTSYDGFTGAEPVKVPPPADAGAEAGAAMDGAAAPALCVGEIPPVPAVPDDGKGTLAGFAISSTLQFSDEPDTCTLGLDLSPGHDCSHPACTLLAMSSGSVKTGSQGGECDQAQGHDDTGKKALSLSDMVENTTFTNVLSDALNRFEIGLLIGVSSYDGLPNDSTVTVSMYNVVGGTQSAAIVDHNDVNFPELDQKAYVNNNLLVAHFPSTFSLRLEIGRSVTLADGGKSVVPTVMILQVTEPVLVAPISLSSDGQLVTLTNAQLGGRIRVVDFAPVLHELDGCGYPIILTCAFADLPVASANDGTTDKCDAISFALQFNAVPSTKAGGGIGLPAIDLCATADAGAPVDGGDDGGDGGTVPSPPASDAGLYMNPCE